MDFTDMGLEWLDVVLPADVTDVYPGTESSVCQNPGKMNRHTINQGSRTRTGLLWLASILFALASCEPVGPLIVDNDDDDPSDTAGYFQTGLAAIQVVTEGQAPVVSKDPADYLACTVTVKGNGIWPDTVLSGKIRGRGNSTWEWYPKKPYRIKLDESARMLGMKKNRDWVLLADYRDVTHMMNNVGFTMAHYVGLPYTNHSRYATLTLNGKMQGLYMVTEQVEAGGHRVDVEGEGGILLALDVNDGPGDCPQATDNFYSKVYRTDCCVKYPSDPTPDQLDYVKDEFAELETAIQSRDWDDICALLDVESMAGYLMIQELIQNVEMDNGNSIRSGYIHRRPDGKWTMGPLWDCDAGFCYDWGDMYDSYGWGHTYFANYRTLVFGSQPATQKDAYGGFPDYFSDLFSIPQFVELFQDRWNEVKDGMLASVLHQIDQTYDVIYEAMISDASQWGISRNYSSVEEVEKLRMWLQNRFSYLDDVFNDYDPDAADDDPGWNWGPKDGSPTATMMDTLSYTVSFKRDFEYTGTAVTLTAQEVKRLEKALDVSASSLEGDYWSGKLSFCAVEPDGTLNYDNTANAPGHWFDADGFVINWGGDSYVFSELSLSDLTFRLGKYPGQTPAGRYVVRQALVKGEKAFMFVFDITLTD